MNIEDILLEKIAELETRNRCLHVDAQNVMEAFIRFASLTHNYLKSKKETDLTEDDLLFMSANYLLACGNLSHLKPSGLCKFDFYMFAKEHECDCCRQSPNVILTSGGGFETQ